MVKANILAGLFLAASVIVFIHVLTSPQLPLGDNRKAASEPVGRQANKGRVDEAVIKNPQKHNPAPEKKVVTRTLPLDKLIRAEDMARLLDTIPPAQPKPEPKTADPGFGSVLPNGVPLWFRTLDTDEDGQVGLYEWRKSGKSIDEFRKYDLNGDGLITEAEVLRQMQNPNELRFDKGQAGYNGAIEPNDEIYMETKLSKIFNIKFEKGKTYQIDHMSKAFDAYLYLEGPDGQLLAENDDGGEGNNSRIVHHAAKTGIYRIVATSLGGTRPGDFSLRVRMLDGGGNPHKGLPAWFKELDKNKDGQVGLYEWREAGRSVDEFRNYDLNGDGFITTDEMLRRMSSSNELKLDKGQAGYNGAIDPADEIYMGRKLAKIFTIKFEKGKTYQIDHRSRAFDAYLYLEGPDGNLVAENDDGGDGNDSRIIYLAARAGVYRIIATSVGGTRPGDFSLLVRQIDVAGPNKGLPAWFKELDTNGRGQVGLPEWREAGRSPDEFREYDLNGDGLITSDEVLRHSKNTTELKFEKGQARSSGTIEASDGKYQGKKLAKFFTIKFEKGRTYQIDMVSQEFSAYLYLEDADGNFLAKIHSGGKGSTARIMHLAEHPGIHRIIATSQEGNRTGAFSISVRIKDK